MSILIRRASIDDEDDIYKIIKKYDYSLNKLKLKYGTSNISYLIDTSAISIVGIDKKSHQIIGFISVSLSPYKDYVKSLDWTVKLPKYFEIKDCTAYNTMYLSCCVYEEEYAADFLFFSLKQIFLTIPNLKYIGYLISSTQKIDPNLCKNVFPRSYNGNNYDNKDDKKKNDEENNNSALHAISLSKQRFFFNKCKEIEIEGSTNKAIYPYKLWMCFRKDLVYIMKIRKARVEDCDDLVPMFKQRNLMNDPDSIYYFSELLENKDKNVNTIVAEVNNRIVGFMSMRNNIEYSALLDNFDLDMFESLINDMVEVDVDEEILKNLSSTSISNKAKKDSKSSSGPDINIDINKIVDDRQRKSYDKYESNDPLNVMRSNESTNKSENDIENTDTIDNNDNGNDDYISTIELNNIDENTTTEISEPIKDTENAVITENESQNDNNDSMDNVIEIKKIAYLNNALCINLFYIEDQYSSYSNELLKAAFNLYPDKEYCLISLPTQELYIPLLDKMIQVDYREDANIRHTLYITHRESTLNTIHVRKGVEDDSEKIENLISDMPEYSSLMHQVNMSILSMDENTDIKNKPILYVAECLDMIIGFAILKTYDAPNVLIEQFNIEKYCTKENHNFTKNDNFILSFIIMNPLYENKARYFIEEIMRQTNLNCLIHTYNEILDFSTHKIITKEFVPIKRRKQVQYLNNKRDICDVADHLNYNISLITTNILYEPKITINTRIVVIGASDTGISFLETLIYKSHYLFNNLILISGKDTYGSKGYPYAVDDMNYSVHDLQKMNIENYVQYINGMVKAINREDKSVVLDSAEVIEYDYLIITTGLQFYPEIIDKQFSKLQGIFSGSKIEECIEFINKQSKDSVQNYVVYGNDIQAFPILKALLDKVPADNIYFVVPSYDKNVRNWFDNRPLEKRVLTLIKNRGVKILLNHKIISYYSQSNELLEITLNKTEDEHEDNIAIDKIGGFFYVDKKTTNSKIFNAINNSYLVFDEKLVIGSHFQTNDNYIFSAGTMTKYTSRYETLWNHSNFNSKECGKKLALTLLPIFEGNEKAIKNIKKENEALISFNNLVATKCILPCNLMFFHFDRPYLYNQTKTFRKTDSNYGRDLIIHNSNDPNIVNNTIEYFHIHIDTYGFIQSLTYVGKEDLFSENMLCLYGMHEKYLNRLILRFDEKIIPDFKEFLNEPWAQPLFYDRFRSYMKRLRLDLMNPNPSPVPIIPLSTDNDNETNEGDKPMEMQEILDKLYEYVSKNEIVPEEERIKLYDAFDKSFDRKKVDYTVYRYLVESGFYNFP